MVDLYTKFQIKIENFFSKQENEILPKKIAVAISGGIDSLALTLLLQQFCLSKKIELIALTIDHKIRPNSTTEALELNKTLTKKNISHQILTINWQEIPTSNIEAKFREERYQLLASFCKKNDIHHLFLGHHLGDVAENFLIRLFRGSGLDGLSTMSEISDLNGIILLRPLLDTSKDELKNFLQDQQIEWFEDETNEDEKFLRNKIRKFFDSFEDKNLIQKRIKKTSDEISELRDEFDSEMLDFARQALVLQENCFYLNLEKFKKVNQKIALKILALISIELSGKNYKPRLEKLRNFYDWILTEEAHKPREFYGCKIIKNNATLIFASATSNLNSNPQLKLRTVLKNIVQ